jgi:hypothetical protein
MNNRFLSQRAICLLKACYRPLLLKRSNDPFLHKNFASGGGTIFLLDPQPSPLWFIFFLLGDPLSLATA